jgi:ketosteroid isomerase-like protein
MRQWNDSHLAVPHPRGLGLSSLVVSERNIDLHRRLVAAINAKDSDAFIALCDPDIEIHPTIAAVSGAVYHGHDGVQKWRGDIQEAWGDEFRLEPEAYFDLGDQTLAFYLARGRGTQSGLEIGAPHAHVCRWSDGLCVYYKGYPDKRDALVDLGLSEDALEPIAP